MGYKSKKYQKVVRARKGRGVIPPRYSPLVKKIVSIITPLYLKIAEGVSRVTVINLDSLYSAFKDHYSNKRKLIIAFRHVAKEDAPVLMHVIHNHLNKKIQPYNKRVDTDKKIITHAQFLYGADVLEWANPLASFIFPRLGAIGVVNRSNNKKGISLLKETMERGVFPVALAPESQVTYHVGKVAQTSSGTSSLALWGEHVSIIPIAIGYHHHKDLRSFIIDVIKKWEKETHIPTHVGNVTLYDSLIFITEETVKLLEKMYHIPVDIESSLKERIDNITLTAITYAEHIANLKGSGTILDRLLTVRHVGLRAQKPEGFDTLPHSPLSSSLLDSNALQAHISLMHHQIVDILLYVDPSYITPTGSLERMSEYALNILDVVNRMKGGNINTRYSIKKKHAYLYVGEPLEIVRDDNRSKKEERKNIDELVKTALIKASEELEKQISEIT